MNRIGFLVSHGVEARYFLLSGLCDLLKSKCELSFYVEEDHCKVLKEYAEVYEVEIKTLPPSSAAKSKVDNYIRAFTNARKRAKKVEIYSHSGSTTNGKFYDFLFKNKWVSKMGNTFLKSKQLKTYSDKSLQQFLKNENLQKMYMLQYDSILHKSVGANCSQLGIENVIFMNSLKTIYIDDFLGFDFKKLFSWNSFQTFLFQQANPDVDKTKIEAKGSPHHTFLRDKNSEFENIVVAKYNLDLSRPIIVYSLINEGIFDKEFELLKTIDAHFMSEYTDNNRPTIVVRRNPFEESTEHIEMMRGLNSVVVADHYWSRKAEKGWSIQGIQGEKEWKALLHLSQLNMNIPSMSTIDSMMCGTPVLNVGFDAKGEFNQELDHIINSPFNVEFEKSQFVTTCRNWEEFLLNIRAFLSIKSNKNNITPSMDIACSALEEFIV